MYKNNPVMGLSYAFLLDSIRKISIKMPEEYRVRIYPSKHFVERFSERKSSNSLNTFLEILEIINYNYPLILYYSKLNTALPNRGRLEHSKYLIAGDMFNGEFCLRTFYEKQSCLH